MHAELTELFRASERERRDVPPMPELLERDRARRARVEALLAEGALRDAADYRHAAEILASVLASDAGAMERVAGLARRTAELGDRAARHLAARAEDQRLVSQGKPQKYGTQLRLEGGRYRLWGVDQATTDEERAAWDVPPLAELERNAERMLATGGTPAVVTFTAPGVRIDLLELPAEAAPRGGPVPAPSELPAGLAPTALDVGYGARRADGSLALSWRRCGWRVEVDERADGYDPAKAAPEHISIGPGAPAYSRLVLRSGADACWLVEGEYPLGELIGIARSLPPAG